jgi:hypothetical protein
MRVVRGWEIDRAHMDGAIGDFRVKKRMARPESELTSISMARL